MAPTLHFKYATTQGSNIRNTTVVAKKNREVEEFAYHVLGGIANEFAPTKVEAGTVYESAVF